MSTPTKKRKNTGLDTPSRQLRSIDSYFRALLSDGDQPTERHSQREAALTDEEIARRLHVEWNADPEEGPRPNSIPREQTASGSGGEHGDNGITVNKEVSEATNEDAVTTGESELNAKNVLSLQKSSTAEDAFSMSLPFNQSPLTFEPSQYVDELQNLWHPEGGSASYTLLTRCFVLVNGTQSRIKIVDTLVNALRLLIESDPESLLPAVWLTTNGIGPPYELLELGLGGSAISKALKKAYGLDNQGLKTLYDKHGDAGDVAFEAKKKQMFTLRRPKPLSIKGVYNSLLQIAKSKGTGSQDVKQRIVEKLLQDARGAEESRYIVRTLVQHLRIGAVKTTMLIALARAFLFSKPRLATFDLRPKSELQSLKKEELTSIYANAEEIVKASFARHPNYNDLVPCLLEFGVSDELLLRCGLTLHVPLRPMLGSITRDLTQMLSRLQGREFGCEYKYDGQRAQVHCDYQGKVSIFSRHLELMTEKYPDLVGLVPQIRGESVSSFILEGEVVAVNQESGEVLPFQTLTNRAKKNVELNSIKVAVCLFAFDLMYLNGEPLLDRTFRERRELLRSLFTQIPNRFTWVKHLDATSTDAEAILTFFKEATAAKCEGIMVKVLDNVVDSNLWLKIDDDTRTMKDAVIEKNRTDSAYASKLATVVHEREKASRHRALLSTYEPDKRLESWLKVKKDYSAASETLDLIPIAGWHGQGRKAKWWSPILLAVRNPETGCLEAVTKCMSGFTDKFYQANKEKYAESGENVISRPSYVEYGGEPEVWFEPQEVWEVAFADITLSPTYTAAIGLVSEERGLSLRFPRFLRVREDKGIDEANTSDYLAHLWRKQSEQQQVEEGATKGTGSPDDDYIEADI